MAYYIFLKSLRRLEEFRKNPLVKVPPKSPSTNFQSLGKFKNPIFNSEIIFLAFSPANLAGCSSSGPASPLAAPFPAGRNHLGQPIQPARRSRLRGKYVFLFRSRLPEPAASPSSLCQLGPTCQNHPLLHAGRPRSEISPRCRSPMSLPHASDAPELLQPSLITLPP
jgi:hypothetical protein